MVHLLWHVAFEISHLTLSFKIRAIEKMVLGKSNCVWHLTFTLSVKYCLYCTLTVTNMAMVRKSICSPLYLTQSEPVPLDVAHKSGLLINVLKLCVNFPITPTTAHDVCHTGLFPRRPEFNSRPLHVGSMVRTVALGDVVIRILFSFLLSVSFHQYSIHVFFKLLSTLYYLSN
jgi:hypothetical protein